MKIGVTGATRIEIMKYLAKNRVEIISMKRAERKCSDALSLDRTTFKAAGNSGIVYENDIEKGVLTRTIIGNTYLWLDSHDDVHLKNVFKDSIKQKQPQQIFHLHDHEFKTTAKVGTPKKYSEQNFKWKTLGVDKDGETQALVLVSEILKAYNESTYNSYLNDDIDQHSVGMQYIETNLALDDKDEKEAYALWKLYIDQLGNTKQAEKQGYFFGVSTAKLFELSCVLAGSNSITPTMIPEKDPSGKGSFKNPLKSSSEPKFKVAGSKLNLNKL